MWTISHIVEVSYLCLLGIIDLKTRRIPKKILTLGIFLAVGKNVIDYNKNGFHSVLVNLAGVGIGIVFIVISYLTREMIGYGDSILIGIIGGCVGLWDLLYLLTLSFVICSVVSLIGLVLKGVSKKETLPFVPFLFLGLLGVICT